MKLYPKQLNSLEELKREKHVLLYAKKHIASEDLFSIDQFKPDLLAKKPTSEAGESTSNIMALVADLLTSKSATGAAMTLGLPLLKFVGLKAGKGIFKPLVKEVAGGYIKWKLIHFGYTTVMGIVKSQKNKKKEEKKHK